ncbi:GNAT family N-acetyltransferase [Microlunatus speluncae]|uniref:GNAT family N-acetyltransferase n=1 Tax=Microlunatus speluncae TaxID=2594267 RepID=UPI001FE9FA87|nr:GNAT family N-acetyltransferase [Microlunatus speluncae]
MTITLSTPDAGRLDAAIRELRDWQHEESPLQLHPGDLGWHRRFGAEKTAAAVRTWSRDGTLVALGFLDDPDVLRLTVAPDVWHEDTLARQVVADLSDPRRGVLPPGKVSVESPNGSRVQRLLDDSGWQAGEPWTPLRRDLADPLDQSVLRIEVIDSGHESPFTAVHRSAWANPRFTDELWQTMTAGSPYAEARCLLGYDEQAHAVAGVTVWSAGPGRPGLLEPMGVHADHRRRGYGAAICIAAAAELKKLGSSSAQVCTQSSLLSAVATYRAAGFQPLPERLDRTFGPVGR